MPGLLLLVSPNAFPAFLPGGVRGGEDTIFTRNSNHVKALADTRLISDRHRGHCDVELPRRDQQYSYHYLKSPRWEEQMAEAINLF